VAQKNFKLAPFAGLPQFAEVCRVEKLGPSGSLSLERGLSLLRCLLADPTLNQKGAENVLAALEAFRVEANDERQEDDVEKDTEETQTPWDRHYHLHYNEEQRCSDLRAGQTRKEIMLRSRVWLSLVLHDEKDDRYTQSDHEASSRHLDNGRNPDQHHTTSLQKERQDNGTWVIRKQRAKL